MASREQNRAPRPASPGRRTAANISNSLRDDRTIFIYGERVKDVTTHPAFRNTARMMARLYDALHDPKHNDKILVPTDTGNGGKTHAFFKAPKSLDDLLAGRNAIAEWAKITYGWLGRSPDYKASFLATLGANAEFYDPYQENARRWYKFSQERVPFVNHAIIHPPVDRDRPPNEVGDVCCHVEKETDAGIIVSGAKVVATGSVLTNYTFVAHHGLDPGAGQEIRRGVHGADQRAGREIRLPHLLRDDVDGDGQPVRLSAVEPARRERRGLHLDKVLVPWENVFVYGDMEKANNFFPRTGFLPRFVVHGCTRLAVKLDFIAGLLLKAVEASGTKDYRGVQANVGEVIAWRNLFWALSDAMVRDPKPWIGDYVLPNMDPGNAYQIIATMAYTKVKYIIEQTVASGLIYLNSHARDFKNAEIRPYLDRYMRGSNGYKAEERVKLMKLLWDCLGDRIRRPPRALRDQLWRLDRGNPPLLPVRRAGVRQRRPLQGLRRGLHGGIRSRRLEGPGPHRSRRTQLSCHARRRTVGRGRTHRLSSADFRVGTAAAVAAMPIGRIALSINRNRFPHQKSEDRGRCLLVQVLEQGQSADMQHDRSGAIGLPQREDVADEQRMVAARVARDHFGGDRRVRIDQQRRAVDVFVFQVHAHRLAGRKSARSGTPGRGQECSHRNGRPPAGRRACAPSGRPRPRTAAARAIPT